jgi:DNA excision repair protein ERCC-3
VLLDEAHTFPAKCHTRAIATVRRAATIGLTATTARCDGRERELFAAIGPILFELDEGDAAARGVVAAVDVRVVRVPQPRAFLDAYAREPDVERRRWMEACNPCKVAELVRRLRDAPRGRAMVFCDTLAALATLATELVPVLLGTDSSSRIVGILDGATTTSERKRLCDELRAREGGVLLSSRAGAVALDVPEVDAVYEMHVGDRSQLRSTQRRGRAARVNGGRKSLATDVVLVSLGTREMDFAAVRDGGAVTDEAPLHDADGDVTRRWLATLPPSKLPSEPPSDATTGASSRDARVRRWERALSKKKRTR